ncbi:AraC family transcriptional regulator [Herbiconiux solani]|uniref:AraC family transcriptional regulator n=1 Tax=Herbiconiux solani TaxID=661329 RepID=UPI00082513CE|nr:helix-turn-helix domain-containing protein [Herbiconiux solani]
MSDIESAPDIGSAPESKGHLNPGDSGVRFDRFELGPGLEELVRHVWVARWSIPAGEIRPQRVLGYPAFNAVVRPEGAALAGPDPRLFVEPLRGTSWVVGVLFRPAAGAALTTTPAKALVSTSEPLPGAPTARIADATGEIGSWRELVAALRSWLLPVADRVDERGRLLNTVCDLAENDPELLRAADLADRAGLTLRSLERLVGERLGVSPKWLIECRRLQEAATTLFAHPETDLSDLAARVGYADYPHFSRRYALFLGETPEAARRAARAAR